MSDLDIVARGEAWKAASSMAEVATPPSGHGLRVVLFGGHIEIFDRWLPGTRDTDDLINSAEFIEGIPFCPLLEVLGWKARSGRVKDKRDVEAIEGYLGIA
ncbi:hypothetical protein PUR34_09700 [Streptomyces sp. JV185]|uniref:hypothetical protein n=1 Tax=Streptomyces sp. JV185 TaxID=858638 RepID=UPI002E78764D|nr:hypothetical protein [Streptomyces sp. JV185]MEE1768430.1 hypothetical protein [Streptomyces sp. JV185]